MRKMFSQKQIEKIAEEYAGGLPDIHSGDAGKALVVNAGETGAEWAEIGLSPEDQEKLDNSLQLPESAPAAQQLVGINTSREQNALGIGDGLIINNNTLRTKDVFVLNASFSSAAQSGQIILTADQKAYINANRPIIKIIFSDYYEVLLQYNYGGEAGGSTGASTYTGYFDAHTTGNFTNLVSSSGSTVGWSGMRICQLSVEPNSNTILKCAFSNTMGQIITGYGAAVVPAALSSVSVSSGDTISNSSLKNLIKARAVCRINNTLCYPIDRSNSPYVSQYFSIALNGTSIEVTHYTIDETTWVITFVTKTIA